MHSLENSNRCDDFEIDSRFYTYLQHQLFAGSQTLACVTRTRHTHGELTHFFIFYAYLGLSKFIGVSVSYRYFMQNYTSKSSLLIVCAPKIYLDKSLRERVNASSACGVMKLLFRYKWLQFIWFTSVWGRIIWSCYQTIFACAIQLIYNNKNIVFLTTFDAFVQYGPLMQINKFKWTYSDVFVCWYL